MFSLSFQDSNYVADHWNIQVSTEKLHDHHLLKEIEIKEKQQELH